jgi:hypothetical protein
VNLRRARGRGGRAPGYFCFAISDHNPRAVPLRRLTINLTHGAEWKTLISTYMTVIPLNGEASCAAKQIMSAPPAKAVSSAMNAKLGAAARHNQSATPRDTALTPGAPAYPPPVGGILFPRLKLSDIATSPLSVLIVAAEPHAGLIAPQGRAVEPLIHAPETVHAARIGRIGVVDNAVLKDKSA